jgi:hypothetical protein
MLAQQRFQLKWFGYKWRSICWQCQRLNARRPHKTPHSIASPAPAHTVKNTTPFSKYKAFFDPVSTKPGKR